MDGPAAGGIRLKKPEERVPKKYKKISPLYFAQTTGGVKLPRGGDGWKGT